jgi:ATP/maltotriose-dependent transcriptional regulator MalT/two-component SAPR family response regulator
MTSPTLLQTKFMVPRVTTSHCRRTALVDMVMSALPQKLVMITAPPGYGKTTLMVDVINGLNEPVVWYQLDEADNDPATFLAYLVAGLRRNLPEIGTSLQNLLDSSEMLPASRTLIILLNELLEAPGIAWTLMLDDYHVINNPAVHDIMTTLIEHRPPDMHIIIATRAAPPLPLPRWRVRGQLLEIRAEQLRFSVDEALHWLKNIIPNLSETAVEALIQKTEGWGAGLQLAIAFLAESQHESYERLIDNIEGTHPYFFNYLMEEVLERQPANLQKFLLESSILKQMNASLCENVLNTNDSQEKLERVRQDNLFLFSLDKQRRWYRFHPLFREFLLAKLSRQEPAEAERLHHRAGDYYAELGEFEEALGHFLEIGHYPRAVEVFSAFGRNYVEQGRVDIIGHYLDKFPIEELNKHPELWWLSGKVLRHQGRINDAISRFERTVNAASELGSVQYQVLALIELAGLIRSRGDYFQSLTLSEKATSLGENCPSHVRALSLMEQAKSTGFLKGMDQGRALAQQAIDEADKARSGLTQFQKAQLLRSLAQICWWHGDVAEAVRYGHEALRNVSNAQSPLAARIMLTLSTPLLYRHEYTDALEYAQKGLDICQQLQLQELLPTAYTVLGNVLTRLGELSRAEQTLREAIKHAEGMGAASYAKVMAGSYLAYNLVAQDRVVEAQSVAEAALWPYVGQPITYEIYVCRSVLADIHLDKGELLKAKQVFEELIDIGETHRYNIPLAMAYFGLAYIHFVDNERQLGLDNAQKSLDLLAPSRTWELYADQGQRAVFVCQQLAKVVPNNPFLHKVLGELSSENRNPVTVLTTPLQQIRVQTLGTFRVFRGQQEIVDWTSIKARDMLAYFITFRYENVGLDRVLADLWPEHKKRGKAAFHTALFRLRQALRHEDDSAKYVAVEVGDYRLDIARFDLDVEHFETNINKGDQTTEDQAVEWYEQAVALYQGTYLDNLYYDWIAVEQQRLEDQMLAVLDSLYHIYARRQNFSSAITTARRLLNMNPLVEEVHCDLMRYFHALGDRKSLSEQYEYLSDVLMRELSVKPLQSSHDLFRKLLAGQEET